MILIEVISVLFDEHLEQTIHLNYCSFFGVVVVAAVVLFVETKIRNKNEGISYT